MPEGISKQEQEPIIVEIIKDTGPEDFTASKRGFQIFIDFMKRLQEKYPEKIYIPPGEEEIEKLFSFKRKVGKKLLHNITFIAKNKTEITGIFIGSANGKTFEGEWFAIDPKHGNTPTAKEIFKAIDEEFDEIRLVASPFGSDMDASDEDTEKRQDALIRYYKKFGFESSPKNQSSMIRRRLK